MKSWLKERDNKVVFPVTATRVCVKQRNIISPISCLGGQLTYRLRQYFYHRHFESVILFCVLWNLLYRIQNQSVPSILILRYSVCGKIYRWMNPWSTGLCICRFEELIPFRSKLPRFSFRQNKDIDKDITHKFSGSICIGFNKLWLSLQAL